MRAIAIIQARCASRRFPGKILADLLGRPMLARQMERVLRSKTIERAVVATTDLASDDAVEKLCGDLGVACYRGEQDDVLARFQAAAARHGDQPFIVRLTGDCPLTDPHIIDLVVSRALECEADYVSNCLLPTFPDGLDVEVIRRSALEKAAREARLPSEREHVTPYLYKHPELFRLQEVANDVDLSGMRWTVDEPADFAFVTAVYKRLYPLNPAFSYTDVLDLLAREPELASLNSQFGRNEGYLKSLEADRDGAL